MSFEQLKQAIKDASIAKADPLAKSEAGTLDAGKIEAAAADGAAAGGEGDEGDDGKAGDGAQGAGEGEGSGEGAGAGTAEPKTEGDGEETELGKSLTLVLEDGTEVEALDASDLLKSLLGRVGDLSKSMGAVDGRLTGYEAEVGEVMTGAIGLIKAQGEMLVELQKSFADQGAQLAKSLETIDGQNGLIQSLRTDLDVVRNQPAGRKSVGNPAEVSAASPLVKSLQNSEGMGMPPQEFLAKCLELQKGGILSLQDCALAEAAIGSNVPVSPAIVSKVFSH